MTHVSLCAIRMIPAMTVIFRRRLKEESCCIEATKYSKLGTVKKLVPISCRCAEQG